MNARVLWVVLVSCLCLLVGLPAAIAAPGDPHAGRTLYTQLCVSCHGTSGQGGSMAAMLNPRPRNLTDTAYMSTRSDQQLFAVIQQGGSAVGLSAAMTAFGSQLNEQQIWDTVAYVRTLAAAAPADTPPAVAAPASPGAPAAGLTMTRLRLSIWPEYDDPRVLVILRGEMAPRQAFPGAITLPLPKGAEIIGAGIISDQDQLLVHPHNVVPGDTLDSLQLNLPTPRFFVEFYYRPFATDTAEKRFTFSSPATYPLELLEVEIQQPLQAANFTVEPPAMERRTDTQKFTYHQYVYRDIPPGQSHTFQIAYTKTSSTPSVPKQTSQPPRIDPAASRSRTILLSLGLLAWAVLMFVGWALLLYRRRAPMATASAAQPPARSLQDTLAFLLQEDAAPTAQATSVPAAQSSPGAVKFCAQCGRQVLPEDRFCAACGKPITR